MWASSAEMPEIDSWLNLQLGKAKGALQLCSAPDLGQRRGFEFWANSPSRRGMSEADGFKVSGVSVFCFP